MIGRSVKASRPETAKAGKNMRIIGQATAILMPINHLNCLPPIGFINQWQSSIRGKLNIVDGRGKWKGFPVLLSLTANVKLKQKNCWQIFRWICTTNLFLVSNKPALKGLIGESPNSNQIDSAVLLENNYETRIKNRWSIGNISF